jgi:4-amino-4-deoxy-L-arabinose transferase-like glycosyltransferase
VGTWAILQIGGLFTPGLLDDVDSIYIQVAREMLQRHDLVTPTIDGIRFFDKPPLMYWLAAGSMKLFGAHDWAARLPLALGMLALLLAVYALGNFLYPTNLPGGPFMRSLIAHEWGRTPSDRPGLYAALALGTSLGPYLYTRFFIPDILIALWMTLSVHLFLLAVDRTAKNSVILSGASQLYREAESKDPDALKTTSIFRPFLPATSALFPMLGFAAVLALSLLTKGLIGIIFPLIFVLLYLGLTRQLRLLAKLHLLPATFVFFAIAAPWHILAALRNPAIAMPAGLGLPARAGWAWFYLYNEHVARFLGRRIPHDYGNVPVPLFWLLLLLWLLPWTAFLPAAIRNALRTLRTPAQPTTSVILSEASQPYREAQSKDPDASHTTAAARTLLPKHLSRDYQAALTLLLWPAIILGFFTLSSRQEYYHLPALPALALLVGGLLAAADRVTYLGAPHTGSPASAPARGGGDLDSEMWAYYRQTLRASLYLLTPFATLLFLLCAYLALTAPTPHPGVTLTDLLNSNPANYNLSLGHLFDLTTAAMGFFRVPLLTVALGMYTLGPFAWLVRRKGKTLAANLVLAAGMIAVLLAAHEGLVRFYPILGSKDLALQIEAVRRPGDLILIDGELTAGSTLLFYTQNDTSRPVQGVEMQAQEHVFLVNGRINGPWFGSFWPDAPAIFLTDSDLASLWEGPQRVFLLTDHPDRRWRDLANLHAVYNLASSGGKTVLTNRP